MKIIIDQEKCIGCGTCAVLCDEVFEMDKNGKSRVKETLEDKKNSECPKEAAEACPVQCIEIK